MHFIRFLASRILTYLLVIWIGITALFFIPRFVPSDPIEGMLARIQSQGTTMEPAQLEAWRHALKESFGLEGTLPQQYFGFLKRVLITGDWGPSLGLFPTPVTELIQHALPWSIGLLLVSTIISWILGNLLGLFAGYYKNRPFSRIFEGVAIIFYPVPYYIVALILIILFAYLWPIFPFTFSTQGQPFTPEYLWSVIRNAFLPVLSMVIVSLGWWMMSMKALTATIGEEDFVHYAHLKGVGNSGIMGNYILRNAILPQVTVLALQLGGIFSGALITEVLFGYPGIGTLIYQSVLQSDYNLMMGTISLSIVAIASTTLLIDLLYPLLDPRIRNR